MRKLLLLAVMSTALGCAAGAEPDAEDGTVDGENTGQATSALVNANFRVIGLGGKCVDVGGDAYQAVGSPVFMYPCNGTTAQRLRVVEHGDGTHDVSLRSNLGFCLGVQSGVVSASRAIELQACDMSAPAQRFALDGDSIMVGTQSSGRVARDLVVEVNRGRGKNRTPLVVGLRDVDPSEDFRFESTSFAALFPTSGFRMIMSRGDLDSALAASHWGSVIEVARDTTIRIDDAIERELREGVTLRSNRKGLNPGSEIYRANGELGAAFVAVGNDVRVTGLRFRGPSTTEGDTAPKVIGIRGEDPARRLLVDHNEFSAWTDTGVLLKGSYDSLEICHETLTPPPQNTRVVANYFHDNVRDGAGYGVASIRGGNPLIDGNTFQRNRHAIAADARGHTSYTAKFNLVTSGNSYCNWGGLNCNKEHDFDVHGNGEDGVGGMAGHSFEIRSNTFMSPRDRFIYVRGTPCNTVRVRDNVFFRVSPEQVRSWTFKSKADDGHQEFLNNVTVDGHPSQVVGDFDGDGVQDDFMGTGTAWYYRAGRSTEWRLLNRSPEKTEQLTFGDFDADGRTDVRMVDAQGRTQTSWGGSSPWDTSVRTIPWVPGGPITPIEPAIGTFSAELTREPTHAP